ncbi:hypothetical protein M406DRAFT_98087 [Cryphonectria parasitica EP155]|uniref:Uncharacterized protein n=1 Tax=Cryphonectria parasitica (strain ATCC 38755 / EP155) TaxID=660469 RepID=A0A9P4Y7L1_CRYP1|nr:uncharacterized protein M406DRAFT_98087 [Cryphonectria parasitica EP155]KAF3767950.1 hypothetical protein M406DRAFT_98087 [Cryphonectria parasitica EP155]
MYLEASRSMYSMLRFSFSCQRALTHFAEQVPRALTERIQVIDVVLSPDYEDGALPELCQTLGNSFPGVQAELRISLHPSRQIPIRPLPDRAYLEPLYALAHTLNQPRKFEIKLPIEGDKFASTRAYGATDYLGDVPFNVTLVPRGSHILYHCTGFNA